jgi:hypothetical protein
MLKRHDEGELHRLAPLEAGLGHGDDVLHVEHLVREELHPHRLHESGRRITMGISGRTVVSRKHPSGPPRDFVKADVGRDLVQPGAKRTALLESREPAPRPHERVLNGILGRVDRAQHPVAVSEQLFPVRLDQAAVGVVVTPASRLPQLSLPHARA